MITGKVSMAGKKLVIGKLVTPLGLLLTEWKVYVVQCLQFFKLQLLHHVLQGQVGLHGVEVF